MVEIKKEQLEMLLKQKSKNKIAKDFNITVYALNKLIKKFNINYVFNKHDARIIVRQNPEINKDWLIKNWVNTNYSIKNLADIYNISDTLLESRITYYKLKKGKLKYNVYTDKLFDIKNTYLWYLAGLIATDGYIINNCDAISITLVGDSEYKLLNNIIKYFVKDGIVHKQKVLNSNKYRYYIRISAYGIKKFLKLNFSIPEKNKTFKLGCPKHIPNEDCAKAYIRGCFDGDGTIGNNKVIKILTASDNFINGIRNIIKLYTGISMSKYIIRNNYGHEYPDLEAHGESAIKILSWIYSLDDCFKLDRKYNKFIKLINNK